MDQAMLYYFIPSFSGIGVVYVLYVVEDLAQFLYD